jgi:hypothetical protein
VNRPKEKTMHPIAFLLLATTILFTGCKSRNLVWQAERKAQIGGEFIRLYDDGQAEYGYGVVTEKLKAKGAYRLAQDTLWLLDPSFQNHFEKGYLVVSEGVVIMESGLHFQVVPVEPSPR